jgi:hypothetical protein
MTSIKSSSKLRSSLCPPRGRNDSPNASMVDRSNVTRSIKEHIRQRDLETATIQEQQEQLAQQRPSLEHAFQTLKDWENYRQQNSTK